MLSNATSTTWINQHQRKGRQAEEDDQSRAVHTGSGQRGAGTKGRSEVDAHARQRAARLAAKSNPHRPHGWSRRDEVRWLATAERGVCQAVRYLKRNPKPGGTP